MNKELFNDLHNEVKETINNSCALNELEKASQLAFIDSLYERAFKNDISNSVE